VHGADGTDYHTLALLHQIVAPSLLVHDNE
jgi:hypothetical protein